MIVHRTTKLNSRRKKVFSFEDGGGCIAIQHLLFTIHGAIQALQLPNVFNRKSSSPIIGRQISGDAGCTLPKRRRTVVSENRATASGLQPARYKKSATEENCSPAFRRWSG